MFLIFNQNLEVETEAEVFPSVGFIYLLKINYPVKKVTTIFSTNQVVIAQWLAQWLATRRSWVQILARARIY